MIWMTGRCRVRANESPKIFARRLSESRLTRRRRLDALRSVVFVLNNRFQYSGRQRNLAAFQIRISWCLLGGLAGCLEKNLARMSAECFQVVRLAACRDGQSDRLQMSSPVAKQREHRPRPGGD